MILREDPGELALRQFAAYLLTALPRPGVHPWALGDGILRLLDERNALDNALHEMQAELEWLRQTAQRQGQHDAAAQRQTLINALFGLRQRTN